MNSSLTSLISPIASSDLAAFQLQRSAWQHSRVSLTIHMRCADTEQTRAASRAGLTSDPLALCMTNAEVHTHAAAVLLRQFLRMCRDSRVIGNQACQLCGVALNGR